jgi:hypothetical protein
MGASHRPTRDDEKHDRQAALEAIGDLVMRCARDNGWCMVCDAEATTETEGGAAGPVTHRPDCIVGKFLARFSGG